MMKKKKYCIELFVDIISPEDGEKEDFQVDTEYYDTYEKAQEEANKHYIGEVVGIYGDGAKCVVSSIEVYDNPVEIDYFDD